ncbi:MAG: cold shock domain-containing protein, partial [Methylobacterium sp.]|nr:cold shock domain-containing protein [Methylobacterium sp.]
MVPSLGRDSEGRPDDQPLDLVEISGSIKWFDVSKGFGFIVPDNGL